MNSIGEHISTRVDEGKKIKVHGTNRTWWQGARRACYVTSNLRYDQEGDRGNKILNGMGKKNKDEEPGRTLTGCGADLMPLGRKCGSMFNVKTLTLYELGQPRC